MAKKYSLINGYPRVPIVVYLIVHNMLPQSTDAQKFRVGNINDCCIVPQTFVSCKWTHTWRSLLVIVVCHHLSDIRFRQKLFKKSKGVEVLSQDVSSLILKKNQNASHPLDNFFLQNQT